MIRGYRSFSAGICVFMSTFAEVASPLKELESEIARGARIISLSGLTSVSAKAYILSELQKVTGKTFAVITDSNKDLEIWERDLGFFNSQAEKPASVLTLPSNEGDIYAGISPHAETLERRALTLWQIANAQPGILIASARSLVTRTLAPAEIKEMGAHLSRDEDFPSETLIEMLVSSGYVREDPLANFGEFSVRGGIMDVWPPNAELPFRIEFFGDTVDSIREFDPETQLSTRQLKEIFIPPMREFAGNSKDFRDWAFFARERFSEQRFERTLKDRTQFADEGESFAGWEYLIALTAPRKSSVFEYLKNCIFVIDEPAVVEQSLTSLYDRLNARFTEIDRADEIGLLPDELFLTPAELRERLEQTKRIEFRALGLTAAETDEEFELDGSDPGLFLFSTAEKPVEMEIQSRTTRNYYGRVKDLADDLKSEVSSRVFFALQTHGITDRLNEILRDYDHVIPDGSLLIGNLSSGFEIPSQKLIFHTESDIFGEPLEAVAQQTTRQTRTRKTNLEAFISDFRDLKPGDYVVHVDHGIGRFEGLQFIETGGTSREFMLLIYADNAKLFVPVERLDLVSRFSSGEGAQPALDRLGGLGWQKTKAKAKRAMRDMADELLRLYAERKLVTGYAFSADGPWQGEFEEAFPYELTADQNVTVEAVKKDMEKPAPMDRLIIGDVGYGKTEVAMRAAFKAAMDSKQVTVLTPTTVLAYQHFETFKKRFAAFPIKIELLSRFRSQKEQKAVVTSAEKGDVDILIGTHRVLSNDVRLPKLGLVVVDEEQRFGVAHKEKLKHLKKKVDVLTLSATPIPRTLNISLLGMRDMSVIETPPRDRLAINTQVVQFSEDVVKSAIELELSRNGQVFFVHNRVETIHTIAAHIQKIVPNARIVVAHGQMNEKEMEQAMLDFVDHKFDVLVATTIIENGIDIPRANTIIINRADAYGLSQLYQLRGRVGRSSRRAYAYLLIPNERDLSQIARRRLSAIREFSDLGAGFRIAALDLELRGAGNILGGQQSGHLDALGFDLYVKMLERTIAELRGEVVEDEVAVSINLGIDVAIPQDYISETGQRLRTYKRISSSNSEEDLRRIYAELEDRYGRVPEPVENLLEYSRLRHLAEVVRIVSIDKTATGLNIKLNETSKVSPEKLMDFVERTPGSSFSPNGILKIVFDGSSKNLIEMARGALQHIAIKD